MDREEKSRIRLHRLLNRNFLSDEIIFGVTRFNRAQRDPSASLAERIISRKLACANERNRI